MTPNQIPLNPVQEIAKNYSVTSDSTLYVGNLHPSIDETALYEMFRHFGELKQCKIMKDIYSQESRGFAFLNYADKSQA